MSATEDQQASSSDRGEEGSGSPAGETMVASSMYSLLAIIATTAFTAVLTLYLVRALGPTEYGVFGLAMGVGGLLTLPADFGISSSASRFIADHRRDRREVARILADGVRLKLVASTITCGGLAALAAPIATAYHAPLVWPLRAIALSVFGQTMMYLFQTAFIADRKVSTNAVLVFAESAAEFTGTVVLVILVGGALGASAGRAVGYCSGFLLALVLSARAFGWQRQIRWRGRGPSVRRIAGYALPLLLVDGAFVLFTQIDILLIGAYLGTRQVGLFNAPTRLLTFLVYPGIALADGVANRMTRGSGSEPDGMAFARALRVLILVQAVLLAPLIVWARPMVDLVLGSDYHGSTMTLRVLSAAAYFGAFAPLVSLSANFLGDAKSRLPLMLGAALLDTGIDIVLIPRIGIVSGAIATGAAYAVMDLGHIIIVRRHVKFPLTPLAISTIRALLAAVAMGEVLLAIGTNPSLPVFFAGGAGSIVAFAAMLILAGELSRSELISARRWLAHRIAPRT